MNTSIDFVANSESTRERALHEVTEQFESYRRNPGLLELVIRLADERGIA